MLLICFVTSFASGLSHAARKGDRRHHHHGIRCGSRKVSRRWSADFASDGANVGLAITERRSHAHTSNAGMGSHLQMSQSISLCLWCFFFGVYVLVWQGDFVQFLPVVMPGLLRSASMMPQTQLANHENYESLQGLCFALIRNLRFFSHGFRHRGRSLELSHCCRRKLCGENFDARRKGDGLQHDLLLRSVHGRTFCAVSELSCFWCIFFSLFC